MALLGDIYGYGDANGIYVDVSSGVFMARSDTQIQELDQAEKVINEQGYFFLVKFCCVFLSIITFSCMT